MNIPKLKKAIRTLVAGIYNNCYGAYGSGEDRYQGEFEQEISEIMKAIEENPNAKETDSPKF